MEPKEIQELLKLINRLEFGEFKYKQGDLEFSARTKHYQSSRGSRDVAPVYHQVAAPAPAPVAASPQQSTTPASTGSDLPEQGGEKVTNTNLIEIRSPIVGTFYRSGSPEKPPYVKPGDTIEVGSVVCIVEAMKLFNEIESEVAGKVVKVVVEDASPVEYDQLLFLIDPNG
jgi:acetyl-CoA carboxylase biotin carboxyl carrier protein